ncbi:hypothetical protein GCM10022210_23260 [Mucilaginibacter dorajii]|uniref:YcxB-like protein domain-containing protein n=2 Tax=Mucilaginibacter dorajii TaxID=692994 RepID=A0ABP7PYF4_9SPHI
MQEKTIHIPFNRTYFLNKQRVHWSLSNAKIMKRYFILTLVIMIVAAAVFSGDTSNRFPLDKIIEGGSVFYLFLWWLTFIERWVRFSRKTKARAERLEKEMMDCTFTFNDEGIDYRDKEKRLQLSWSLFNSAIIFKDTLFILVKESAGVMFFFSRQELGDKEFNEVFELLQSRIDK